MFSHFFFLFFFNLAGGYICGVLSQYFKNGTLFLHSIFFLIRKPNLKLFSVLDSTIKIRRQVLIYPTIHTQKVTESAERNADGYMGSKKSKETLRGKTLNNSFFQLPNFFKLINK